MATIAAANDHNDMRVVLILVTNSLYSAVSGCIEKTWRAGCRAAGTAPGGVVANNGGSSTELQRRQQQQPEANSRARAGWLNAAQLLSGLIATQRPKANYASAVRQSASCSAAAGMKAVERSRPELTFDNTLSCPPAVLAFRCQYLSGWLLICTAVKECAVRQFPLHLWRKGPQLQPGP